MKTIRRGRGNAPGYTFAQRCKSINTLLQQIFPRVTSVIRVDTNPPAVGLVDHVGPERVEEIVESNVVHVAKLQRWRGGEVVGRQPQHEPLAVSLGGVSSAFEQLSDGACKHVHLIRRPRLTMVAVR